MPNSGTAQKGSVVRMRLGALLFTVMLFSASCVSLKEYNIKKAELAEITEGTKLMRKELRDLEKEKKVLLDTIQKRNERARSVTEAIRRRLAANKIRTSLNPEAIKGLTIHSPVLDPAYYAELMQRYPNRDTHSAKKITWLS
jgi:uncharacterized protein YlxW (UPF0749 family)